MLSQEAGQRRLHGVVPDLPMLPEARRSQQGTASDAAGHPGWIISMPVQTDVGFLHRALTDGALTCADVPNLLQIG